MASNLPEERRRRREEILQAARALRESDRASFLDAACSQDGGLRAEIQALLEEPENDDDSESTSRTPARHVLAEISQLGPYRLLRPIGRGGMGVVYEAQDTRLGRRVAIKVLSGTDIDSEETNQRFLREARAASALEHPNICSIYDIGETSDGRLYIVMAYYAGETLRDKLINGPLPIDDARDIAIQLARGLKRAHDSGIVHRDIKPANVIVTHDREVKLLDFGLAKLAGAATLTRTGGRPGTPAYMAPEQLRGETPIDGRSDIWALGVVLYEMIAGRHPFRGTEESTTLHAILERNPQPLDEIRTGLPNGLARIVDKALAKDRSQRYQNIGQFLADLEAGVPPADVPAFRPVARRLPMWIAGAAALAIVAATTVGIWRISTREPPRITDSSPAKARAHRSLAVLHFRNLTGDPELEWLRNGLTEMLVTDLSQSPEIDVPSSARVYESLATNDLLDQPTLSFEGIRKVAADVGAQAVVRGSYARLGDRLRIVFTVEDAENGRILGSDRVEGVGEENLFAVMDEVSAAIRNSFQISRPAASPPTLAEATTSSLEAWRLYSEGLALSRQFKTAEAVVLLERAVELDSSFALALAELGGLHSEMGHETLADQYMRRALKLSERLPLDEKYRVEGTFYAAQWATLDRAIEIYRKGLEVYPNANSWRNNLARRYAFQERYEEALEEFDRLIERGSDFPGTHFDAANARTALGQFEVGYGIVSRYVAAHGDGWFAHQALGWFLTEWGKLDEAEESFDAAEALRPGEWSIPYARWRAEVLRENWQDAERYAAEVAGADEPLARWRGRIALARNAQYRGRAREALRLLDEAVASYAEPNAYTALARCWKAELLLETGDPVRSLAEARSARDAGVDEWPERQALGIAALAHQALGEISEADARLAELRRLWQKSAPSNQVEKRHVDYVEGLVALARGNVDSALEHLRHAAMRLPTKGVEFHWHVYPHHVPLWTALGEAELAAGNADAAMSWFEKAAESGSEHLEQPLSYVRSYYFLGRLHIERGEREKARRYFQRFLKLWGEGEIDRERVREARSAGI